MLEECMEVFKHVLGEKGDSLILDSYIPADGTYLIVGKDGSLKGPVDIRMDKKTKTLDKSSRWFPELCFYDYHSQLLSMNKPIDSKKIIHSNNYLSFFVKKESITLGKLTDEIIDGYYEILKNPIEKKYKKSKEAVRIYTLFEEEEGRIDTETVGKYKRWIKEHLQDLKDVDMSRKDYLKIFFEEEKETYEREGRRYFLPNIYNSNDYNVEINSLIYGVPDNNLGMNAKKPFLFLKSRKIPVPYLLDGQQVLVQKKFFDYLMNLASSGKYHVYIDTERNKIKGYRNGEAPERIDSGYYLRIRKGKSEAEILNQDNISGYRKKLKEDFNFYNIAGIKDKRHQKYEHSYGRKLTRLEMGRLISEVFFSNYLESNYMIDASDINITDEVLKKNILLAKDAIFDWVYKGNDRGLAKMIEKVSLSLIKGTLMNGYEDRALWQLNLRWSFREYFLTEGEENMAEIIRELRESMEKKILANETMPMENDKEYYYAVGQLVAYLISLSKAKDKKQSLLNPFLNAKTDEEIKRRILQIYKKYNYDIADNYKRVKNLLAMIEGYVPDGKVNQEILILGYASDNLVYKKGEK